MQELYQPVEWMAEQMIHERGTQRSRRMPRRRGSGRNAMARGLRRLADAIDG